MRKKLVPPPARVSNGGGVTPLVYKGSDQQPTQSLPRQPVPKKPRCFVPPARAAASAAAAAAPQPAKAATVRPAVAPAAASGAAAASTAPLIGFKRPRMGLSAPCIAQPGVAPVVAAPSLLPSPLAAPACSGTPAPPAVMVASKQDEQKCREALASSPPPLLSFPGPEALLRLDEHAGGRLAMPGTADFVGRLPPRQLPQGGLPAVPVPDCRFTQALSAAILPQPLACGRQSQCRQQDAPELLIRSDQHISEGRGCCCRIPRGFAPLIPFP